MVMEKIGFKRRSAEPVIVAAIWEFEETTGVRVRVKTSFQGK